MKKRVAAISAIAGVISLAVASQTLAADSDAAKAFKKAFVETQNSWERRALVERLDPSDPDSLDLLIEFVLKQQEWYMREGAIQTLSSAYAPATIQKLEKLCGSRGDPMVIEGICMAFGRSGNKDRVPFLLDQLKAKNWKVKRAAAIALSLVPDKRAVGDLISAWEDEEKFMVWVHILESLEKITRQKNMPRPQDWRGWWEAVKDTWTVPTEDPDKLDAEEMKSGDHFTTKVRGTSLDTRLRGKGLPLLVMPDFGNEDDYLQTYLRNLEETNQIIYMKLPGMSDFTDPPLPIVQAGLALYPIDRLVDAFEDLHKELVKQKKIEDKPFAIMAHGISTWIAMQYAAKYPQRVRRMILIAPTSGGKAWSDARDRLERTGQTNRDLEMEHLAQSMQLDQSGKPRFEPTGNEEGNALRRKNWTCYFADYRDLEIGRILGPMVEKQAGGNRVTRDYKAYRPMGGCLIPNEFSLFKLDRVQTPTLVVLGNRSVWTSAEDGQAIVRHYGSAGRLVPFANSDQMPFIEENEKFVEIVQKFMGSAKR